MTLSRYQLERTDITVEVEQGRRVELAQFEESHRNMKTMGELLKARMFGATEWAISLRKRLIKFQGGGIPSAVAVKRDLGPHAPHPPEPHPDLDAENY